MTTLIADPRVIEIAVHDNEEPLVDLAGLGVACSDSASASSARRLVRRGVAERLLRADAALPAGVRLLVVEGLRTASAQQDIVDWYLHRLAGLNPRLADSDLQRLASRYVAPLHVAPHVAGAAVDLTLVGGDGARLDLGTPVDATPEESDNECAFDAPSISTEARANRSLLAAALRGAGLVNYPTEWWHWSYGDRYWAYATGSDTACYGPVTPHVRDESTVGSRS
jgi:zinc D-Ala-D-Ala dipeptidase